MDLPIEKAVYLNSAMQVEACQVKFDWRLARLVEKRRTDARQLSSFTSCVRLSISGERVYY